jgi:hypothetical protein
VATLSPALTEGLDKDARVYVEPYVVSSSMRFDYGTVSNPKVPSDTTLSDLDRDGSLLFRIKVVDESGQVGQILADANGIRPNDAQDDGTSRKSLFPVQWKDLGERIWRVEYNRDSGPELQLTTKISDLPNRLKHDALLQGTIYPHAFREVLLILVKEEPDFDEDEEWVKNWYKFVFKLTGTDLYVPTFGDDEKESFIEDAVNRFALAHRFGSRAKQAEEATQ